MIQNTITFFLLISKYLVTIMLKNRNMNEKPQTNLFNHMKLN